jgi:hypothetical protein
MAHRLLYFGAAVALVACGSDGGPERPTSANERIIGGVVDDFRSYVVGVGTPYDEYGRGGPICSGTLVSRRTVLTAAHCVSPDEGPQGGVTAIFFGADLTPPLGARARILRTVRAVRHPRFDPQSLSNDLALVELASDATAQGFQPVPLLRETMTDTPDYVGPPLTFVGYGNDGEGRYGIRRVAVLPLVAVGPSCAGRDTGSGPIDATQLYYRVRGRNTCDGDSGGPAFLPRGGVERVAGATSAGDTACVVDGTDARTDGPAILEFIQPTIDRFEGLDPCRADGVCDPSCDTGGTLVDPDCAPFHCGADGVCALSCTDPPDPDCGSIDHASLDGVCDRAEGATDPDCQPFQVLSGSVDGGDRDAGVGGGKTGGAGNGGASTTTGGPAGDASSGGESGGDEGNLDCGCKAAGRGSSGWEWFGAGLALAVWRRRRMTYRHQSSPTRGGTASKGRLGASKAACGGPSSS